MVSAKGSAQSAIKILLSGNRAATVDILFALSIGGNGRKRKIKDSNVFGKRLERREGKS